MKTIRSITVLLFATAMVFMVAACSHDTKPEPEVETLSEEYSVPQEESQTDEVDGYDIAANLRISVDGDKKTVDTDHFTISLTHESTWDCEGGNNTSIIFYNIAGREAGCGGRLLSLIAYEQGDKTYEQHPHYCVVGEKGGKVYVAEFPSDVQADIENERNMNEYMDVYAEISRIEENTADSPLILK